mmetsp:Transcript_55782/g.109202  ORF Transcript_55782/g.109202 Transcript_55782/m.109202 type:complete len:160 (+) Transcript_55782:893-1372(+)
MQSYIQETFGRFLITKKRSNEKKQASRPEASPTFDHSVSQPTRQRRPPNHKPWKSLNALVSSTTNHLRHDSLKEAHRTPIPSRDASTDQWIQRGGRDREREGVQERSYTCTHTFLHSCMPGMFAQSTILSACLSVCLSALHTSDTDGWLTDFREGLIMK